MGCGSSAQPADDTQGQPLTEKDPATKDEVEPFNDTKTQTKTPSPKNKTKQKETISDGPVPEPSAYVPAVDDDNIDALSSIDTPFGGSPHSSVDNNDIQDIRVPVLSPGYKMENETRKIGGFDPEAFRKANANNNGGSNQAGNSTGDGWAQPVPSNNNNSFQQQQQYNTGGYSTGGNGDASQNQHGGYGGNSNAGGGDRWGSSGQGDYIQSEDIFSTESPQAMQHSSSMNFRDDALSSNDPFRSPGGMGHNPAQPADKLITHEDDALMDDILGELDEL